MVTVGWSETNPESLSRLIRGCIAAGSWLDRFENRRTAVELLSRETTLNLPQTIGVSVLTDGFRYIRELGVEPFPDYAVFHRYASHYPWLSDALWLLSQMVRWGQLTDPGGPTPHRAKRVPARSVPRCHG